jgi:hypothetical protein
MKTCTQKKTIIKTKKATKLNEKKIGKRKGKKPNLI